MSTTNTWYVVSAAFLGCIGAAGIIIAEHFMYERRQNGMARDLQRLEQQLLSMKQDLEQMRLQKERSGSSRASKRGRCNSPSVRSSVAWQDYKSVADGDSSDLEFYDFTDEDEPTHDAIAYPPFTEDMSKIDEQLNSEDEDQIRDCIDKLNHLRSYHVNQPELMWRLGRAFYNLSCKCADNVEKRQNINRGLEVCSAALKLNPKLAETHKWFAILIGSKCDFLSTKEKIASGFDFKKHIDIAIGLNPDDPSLHHLLGRFKYEVAGLKWYERKIASSLFATPPSATYDEALGHFMEAEELSTDEWKENKMMIGKCLIAIGDVDKALDWLRDAEHAPIKSKSEETLDTEINQLLDTYERD